MKSYKSLNILALFLNAFFISMLIVFMTMRSYYQYKIVKHIIPEITFWEWYWGFSK